MLNNDQNIAPSEKAYLAIFPGAVAILTTQGKVVICPTVARLLAGQLVKAADRAEHHANGAFHAEHKPKHPNVIFPISVCLN
jgi:hypothetical protein